MGCVNHAISNLCDLACQKLKTGDAHAAVTGLCEGLAQLRLSVMPYDWHRAATVLRSHPIHRLLLQSPFTRRAFEKPRGYAGDAETMDLIYTLQSGEGAISPLGQRLYSCEFESPACCSVRHRRMRLAWEIDAVAAARSSASVLALACGYLREAEFSVALRAGKVRITAIDQDAASVAVVASEYGALGVCARVGSVRDVVRGGLRDQRFDLVYAAGLYDYLAEDLAARLTATLFGALTPGGRLLIANFTSALKDAGYMEACMDWRLVYRDEPQMEALLRRLPSREIAHVGHFRDPGRNVVYTRVGRR